LTATQPHTILARYDNMAVSYARVLALGEAISSEHLLMAPMHTLRNGLTLYSFFENDVCSSSTSNAGTLGFQSFDGERRRIIRDGTDATGNCSPTFGPVRFPASLQLRIGGHIARNSDMSITGRLYDLFIYRPRLVTDTVTCGSNNDTSLSNTLLITACRCVDGYYGRPPNCLACGPNELSVMSGSFDRVCQCVGGYYGTPGNCTQCSIGSFCPRGTASPVLCPAGTTTVSTGSFSWYDCSLKNEWIPSGLFSTRLQFSGYSGPMMRLRRSSDSALADLFLGAPNINII
jgi:hypothetical protein